jgi:hypothetical protein
MVAGSLAVGTVCACGAYLVVRGSDRSINSTVFTEVRRITSPDGAIDAILASAEDTDSAASYQVAVARRGLPMGQGKTVFVVDQVDGVELLWRDTRTLFVKSPRGRVFRQLLRMNSPDSLLAEVKVEYARQ